ncbi:hypothetical protein E0L01_10780 [Megamonas funiformis]|uniref:hypothetical protein n=1 Tax=Megamonas funiformis TaxID=437897 RepID=UPI001430AB27|nr:hypothetical protein [Megamonas funiformis]NJE29244.1 hypothetical protein [Megamonas funiformis]
MKKKYLFNIDKKFFYQYIFIAILILISFNIGIFVPSIELDSAYSNAYNYFFYENMQFGKDIIFTYGPLGEYFIKAIDNQLYFIKIICQVLLYIYFYYILFYIIKNSNYIIWLLIFIIFILNPFLSIDVHLYFIELFIFYSFLDAKITLKKIILNTIVLSVLANYKFSFFLLNVGAFVLIFIYLILNNKIKIIGKIFCAVLMEYLIIWILLAQKIENFIVYIINYFNISVVHYLEAMSSEDMKHGYWYILIAILISIYLLYELINSIIKSRKKNKIEWLKNKNIYFWSLIVFFNWILFKYGFGRHDWYHQTQYWIYTIFEYIFILFIMQYNFNLKKKIGLIIAIFISCISMSIPQYEYYSQYSIIDKNINNIKENIQYLIFEDNIFNRKEVLLKEYELKKQENKLSKISSIIKDSTVDIYNYQQNYLLFNDLTWTPRPIFQSYLAHSQYLINKNHQFIEQNPPEYILFKTQTIDNRLSLMADNLWIRDVLYNYEMITQENDILLLKKKNEWIDINNEIEIVKTQNIGFDENIELDNEMKFVSMDIEYSFLGKIIGFLWKTPSIYLEIELETGDKIEKRIIADMMKSPVYISNFIENNQDLLSIMGGNLSYKKIKNIKIKRPKFQKIFFDDKIKTNFYDMYNLTEWNL